MPPVLDPANSKVDGLAFLGLSLTRRSDQLGHPDSVTHQTAFDLNDVLDRDYQYLCSTNDDGWLVGGGEAGPPHSYKLAAPDSAHVEIMRLGTYRKDWGGFGTVDEILQVFRSGQIRIPFMEVLPTAVVANQDLPPELEIRFDMEPAVTGISLRQMMEDSSIPLPANWQLRFLHNQLFQIMQYPSRFCPGAFHSTIVRKAEFRSAEHREGYFAMCQQVIEKWKQIGVQPLIPTTISSTIQRVSCAPCEPVTTTTPPSPPPAPEPQEDVVPLSTKHQDDDEEEEDDDDDDNDLDDDNHKEKDHSNGFGDSIYKLIERVGRCLDPEPDIDFDGQQQDNNNSPNSGAAAPASSGLWLFTDRNNITHWIEPNFLPPYDTADKRAVILRTLSLEWEEKTLSWRDLLQDAPSEGQ